MQEWRQRPEQWWQQSQRGHKRQWSLASYSFWNFTKTNNKQRPKKNSTFTPTSHIDVEIFLFCWTSFLLSCLPAIALPKCFGPNQERLQNFGRIKQKFTTSSAVFDDVFKMTLNLFKPYIEGLDLIEIQIKVLDFRLVKIISLFFAQNIWWRILNWNCK